MNKQVFISYHHEDADSAENLMNKIKGAGFDSWVDSENLRAGEEWQVSIDQAIKSAFALIVIMTPNAQASEYVTYEWSFAWGAGIKVIPVMYKQTQLHPRLKTLQYLDFTNYSTRPWGWLFEALKIAENSHSSTSTQTSQDVSPQIVEAAKLLVAAAIDQVNVQDAETQYNEPALARETEKRISELITPKASQQLAEASVLWVDEQPENNIYERQALEQFGIQFTISTSTEDALQKLQHGNYKAIIFDMDRTPDRQAEYTFLQEIRKRGVTAPFIIYAGNRDQEFTDETRRSDDLGTTNMPSELFEMVVNAIKAG
ncbi:MAG: TIR domain-containing protein [Ktedonobacteraceae bacterium]